MPPVVSPLNEAHQHASNADDFHTQGLLVLAAEEHYKAAEAFLACVEQSNDDNTKRTLKMLYNDHCKVGKDLQRKIALLREEGKDPNQPQLPTVPRRTSVPTPVGPRPTPSPPPTHRARGMADMQNTVDESFMVLGRSDPGDAFNQFWKIMEGMLDNLSQPVAFATVPLASPGVSPPQMSSHQRHASSSSDSDDISTSRGPRRKGGSLVQGTSFSTAKNNSPKKKGHSLDLQTTIIDLRELDDEFGDDGYDSSDSFCMVPSGSGPSLPSLQKENEALKTELETMRNRMAQAERMMKMRQEQDQQLRDNIVLAKREAQRAMGASAQFPPRSGQSMVDLTQLNLNIPPIPPPVAAYNPIPGRDREAQLLKRIRDLEEELRTVRSENDKQKAMIAKFRERWEKLKESAKRKRSAKAAATDAESSGGGVRERIDEEPEAEEAEEKASTAFANELKDS